jgi:diguanylate cyclase (GGDEF)-like protein/PAS domain S-box-containing protein
VYSGDRWRAGACLSAIALVLLPVLTDAGTASRVAQAVTGVVGLAVTAVLWRAGATAGRRGWRLLAVATLIGALARPTAELASGAGALDPVDLGRALATIPGHVLAVVGLLTLLPRGQLRAGGIRLYTEIAIFACGSVVLAEVLVVAPAEALSAVSTAERAALSVTVMTGAALLSAALTLVVRTTGLRRCAAAIVLGGLVAQSAADGLAVVFGARTALASSAGWLLTVAGLALVALAARRDPGPDGRSGDGGRTSARIGHAGSVLPHLVVLLATAGFVVTLVAGDDPRPVPVGALLACVALTAVHRWVTVRDEARIGRRLRRSEAYFRSLVRSQTDAVLLLDDDARVIWAAPSITALLEPTAPQLTGRRLADVLVPEDVDGLVDWLAAAGTSDAPGTLRVLRLPRAGGRAHHLEAAATDLRSDPQVGAVVLYCRNVTARVEREQELSSLAYTDVVTRLPNRTSMTATVAAELADSGRGESSLLLVQVAGLREARRELGEVALDLAMAEVGQRLRGVLRADDVVGRTSGAIFAVLCHGSVEETDLVAARCLSVIEQPITTDLGLLDLSAGVGVAEATAGSTAEDLFGRAELALADACSAGTGIARRYGASMGETRRRREDLLRDLVGARARGQLSLLFQPIVSLGEQRITGVEAMLRWVHPVHGEVPREELRMVAERAGLHVELERWVIEQAACAVAELPTHGDPLRLGVDVCAAHVAAGTLTGDVTNALAVSGLPARQLVVELAASSLDGQDEALLTEVAALRLVGVRVALDGFGVGNSSMTALTALPVHVLKVDRTFLARIDRDARTRALCEAIIRTGSALDFDVVADGVETASELAALRRIGCGFAQGFQLSRPLTAAGLRQLLNDRAGQLWPGMVGQA